MSVEVVGLVLLRNEDLHVERAIRNVAQFCDSILAFDHLSSDQTPTILARLAGELGHLEVVRTRRSADAHRAVARYAGTRTWVLGVDGDELYDPVGLSRLRRELERGTYDASFRLTAHVLNCDLLDPDARTAAGWMSPPSRPVTKLYNFAAIDAWPESPDPLQSGDVTFRPGYDWSTRRSLADDLNWDDDPLRMLHTCFLQRSTTDLEHAPDRPNLDETRDYDRSLLGSIRRRLRPPAVSDEMRAIRERGESWKRDKYRRGERVAIDASPFLTGG